MSDERNVRIAAFSSLTTPSRRGKRRGVTILKEDFLDGKQFSTDRAQSQCRNGWSFPDFQGPKSESCISWSSFYRKLVSVSFLCRDLARSFCGRRMGQDRGHFAHEGPGGRLGNANEPALSGHRRLLRRNHPSVGEYMGTGSGSVASSGHTSSGTGGTSRPYARSCRLTREATGRVGVEDDSAEAACRRACTRCAGV